MNARSIGIEHVAADGDTITPSQETTSIALIRWLMVTYAIDLEGIIPHCCVHPTSCCGDLFKDYGGGRNLSCLEQNAALKKWLAANGIAPERAAAPQPSTASFAAPASSGGRELNKMTIRTSEVSMDPQLTELMDTHSRGEFIEPTVSTPENTVAVIAVVNNAVAWCNHQLVDKGIVIAPSVDAKGRPDGAMIVTGRVAANQLANLRKDYGLVRSLKASQQVHETLSIAVPDVNAQPVIPKTSSRGRGVVVGIIDMGCDFAHRNFIDTAGHSRIEAIWHQAGAIAPMSTVPYGRVYERAQIEAALAKPASYSALGYGPQNGWDPFGTHGTHVMDIASGSSQQAIGMASDATILFVDLSSSDIPWSGPERVGKSFGDSVRLVEAVKWIFDRAGNRPCVINLSLGTNGGPHDGSNPFERAIDGLLHEKPNRAVVIAAANCYGDNIHARVTCAPGTQSDMPLTTVVGAEANTEVWYNTQARLDIEVLGSDGQSLGRVSPGQEGRVTDTTGATVLFVASRVGDPANGDNTIGVFIGDSAPQGTWTLRFTNSSGTPADIHAWIERADYKQGRFVGPLVDPAYTLGSISCGHAAITVGSYDAHKPAKTISYFSSSGPTRDGRQKPEIAAPGTGVVAAKSASANGVTEKSGTSMAAPIVTGAIAIMLGEALQKGQSLDIDAIRQKLLRNPRLPAGQAGWDMRYGFGALNTPNVI